jgi:hypothetical protein
VPKATRGRGRIETGCAWWRSEKGYRDTRESRPVKEEAKLDAVMMKPFILVG